MSDAAVYVLDRVMLTKEAIQDRVSEIAAAIRNDFVGKEVILVGVLKGAAIFLSDLARYMGLDFDLKIDFIAVSSYGDSSASSGVVKIIKDMDTNAEGKNIILVEDIMDTGLTLAYLREIFTARRPGSFKTCVMLEKPERKKMDSVLDYKGFTIPDKFVVGYGLDYAGKWRHLPDIWCVAQK